MQTKLPILYTFRRCPYAMRARMAIVYADIDVEQREIALKDKPQAMLNASPKGTVPVLILANGKVIDESLNIMCWALKQRDHKGWLAHQQQALALIQSNDHQFKACLDKYKYAGRFPEQSQTFYRQQGEVFLQALEELLAQHTFLLTDQPTLADFAIFPFIRQFAFVDKAWFDQSPYPKLQAWLEYHLQNNLFKKIMVKHPIWIA